MPRKNWPYVNSYRDRSGKMRHYFRRAGHAQIPMPGRPGSATFIRAYEAAVAGAPRAPNLSRLKAAGKVYFLSDGDYIKIGFTTDWVRRKSSYMTHSARKLILVALISGTREIERSLHKKFAADRTTGEWFRYSDDIWRYLKETAREHEVTHTLLKPTNGAKNPTISVLNFQLP